MYLPKQVNGSHVEKKVKQTLILCIAKVAYVDVCLESLRINEYTCVKHCHNSNKGYQELD